MFYVWQMNDGRWHISALSGRPGPEILADSERIRAAGFDTGFETKRDARVAYDLLILERAENLAWDSMMQGSEADASTVHGEEGKSYIAWCAAADACYEYRKAHGLIPAN